jgi:hypothetical protein
MKRLMSEEAWVERSYNSGRVQVHGVLSRGLLDQDEGDSVVPRKSRTYSARGNTLQILSANGNKGRRKGENGDGETHVEEYVFSERVDKPGRFSRSTRAWKRGKMR